MLVLPGPPCREDLHPPDDPRRGLGDRLRREAQYLHAYVHRLRQKLDDRSATFIRTVPGVGYSLSPDPVTAS